MVQPRVFTARKAASVQPRLGLGRVTGCALGDLDCLGLPLRQDPFARLRPPLSHKAMALSLELASLAYHLELDDWFHAGWTDCSVQIDNTLQSGVVTGESASGEQMRSLLNTWKLYRAKASLRERNPIFRITGALRQRERSDTIKAVTMLRKQGPGRYVVAIGFMGTGSRFYDWFSNLRFLTEEGFHKGFSQLTEYFEQSAQRILFPDTARELGLERLTLADILQEMKSPDSRFLLWMAGHSQGAAVMQVFCHRLLTDWGALPRNMVGCGFASPTVATGRLPYDPARYPLYHVMNSDDAVARIGAQMHLGLCLEYRAHFSFRKAVYSLNPAPEAAALRQGLLPFFRQTIDTPSLLETSVAFCYCLLEEKGEESLSQLIDKKWTPAPIDRMLSYAGDKAQDVVRAFAQYAEKGYISLAGHGMDPQRLDSLKARLTPLVRQHTLRQLLAALGEMLMAPHGIMRDHFKRPGAYGYIVQQGWAPLRPFIWVKQPQGLPRRSYGRAIPWVRKGRGMGVPGAFPLEPIPARRGRPAAATAPKGVRGKGISARRMARRRGA